MMNFVKFMVDLYSVVNFSCSIRYLEIEMKVSENHPRIRIIKNYNGKYCDNYAE
jgi:hypothetical protein